MLHVVPKDDVFAKLFAAEVKPLLLIVDDLENDRAGVDILAKLAGTDIFAAESMDDPETDLFITVG